jgi:hypothetical protein
MGVWLFWLTAYAVLALVTWMYSDIWLSGFGAGAAFVYGSWVISGMAQRLRTRAYI